MLAMSDDYSISTHYSSQQRPTNIGIKALEIYFPKRCILQSDLEKHDGVSAGKYTIGLGQTQMGFCDDREDINSICLTVVKSLMEKYNISYKDIGRLEVGTETIIDKSKSVKSCLMQLFAEHENNDLEGVDTTNACYGGTSALFNAVQWMESSYWDGRNAIVVAGDIAIYASGNARPTSGVGVVAMLVGPNAPLVMEPGLRGTFMEHSYDFYKPNLSSEYPEVDGPLTIVCYLKAVDKCYKKYVEKLSKRKEANQKPLIDNVDFACFHSPYAKIVQKAIGRLFLNDFLRFPDDPRFASLSKFKDIDLSKTYLDKSVESLCVQVSKDFYSSKCQPSLLTCKMIGNMYCGSLYGSLISLLDLTPEENLMGKRILMFSYGSGLASTMFSLRVAGPISHLVKAVNLSHRLESRTVVSPVVFEELMGLREKIHNASNYEPVGDVMDNMWSGTYYLTKVDEKYRRFYNRKMKSV